MSLTETKIPILNQYSSPEKKQDYLVSISPKVWYQVLKCSKVNGKLFNLLLINKLQSKLLLDHFLLTN